MRRRKAERLTLLGVALTLGSCGSDFEPGYRVEGPRILAAQADLPFAHPGETVHVTALAVDPTGDTLALTWTACDKPASTTATGCVQALANQSGVSLVALSGGTPYSVSVPSQALASVALADEADVDYGAIAVLCPGAVSLAAGPEGLPLRCDAPGGAALPLGDYDVGVKRIYVRHADRNANPVIESITFDGLTWSEGDVKAVSACSSATENDYDSCSGESHQIEVQPTAASFESGTDEAGSPYAEQLLVQYYATDGIVQYPILDGHTPETGYKAREGSVGKMVRLWFVILDDRGGAVWATRTLSVH